MGNTKIDLDTYDKKILKILGENGYLKNVDLSEAVGLSPSACHQRLARLKKIGVLQGFSANINVSRIVPSVRVLTLLMLEKQDLSEYRRMNSRLRETPQIVRAHRTAGDFDYAFETIAHDFESYRLILERVFDGFVVKQYQSRVMQEEIKVSNVVTLIGDD